MDEVRNPFNKNIHQKDDYHSEIDKLEELKNRGITEGDEEKRQIGYVGEEKRPGGNIYKLKQKIINPGSAAPRENREIRQPFQEI